MTTVATAEAEAGKAKRATSTTKVNAAPIREAHKRAEKASQESLRHAKRCGELLIAAKRKLVHGDWLPWLEKQCEIEVRTAQRYMRLAGGWHLLVKEHGKNDSVSYMHIGEALKEIHRLRPPQPTPHQDALRKRVEADERYEKVREMEARASELEQQAKRLHAEARQLAKEIEQSFKMNTVH